jgi:hypothetical protein
MNAAPDFDKDKMIEKIKKLLALSASSNENEAALAAARVQEMLGKYNLTMLDLKEELNDELVTDDETMIVTNVEPQVWQRSLRNAVAKLYFCMHFYTPSKQKPPGRNWYYAYDRHSYVGAQHNVTVAKLMSEFLVDTVNRFAKEQSKTVPQADRARFRTSFRNACSSRLCVRLYDKYEAARQKPADLTTGNMMVLYDETAAKLKEVFDKLKLQDKKQKLSAKEALGVAAGLRAGDEISLDTQIEGTKAASHMLTSGVYNGPTD